MVAWLGKHIKGDSKIDFVGSYKPTTFKNRGEVKGLKPSVYVKLDSPIPGDPSAKVVEKKDNKQNIVGFANPSDRKGARYLRIEIPGDNKILTLNEVEIISGGKNVARQGKATQSSVGSGGVLNVESTATRTLTGRRRSNPYRWIWIHKPLVGS